MNWDDLNDLEEFEKHYNLEGNVKYVLPESKEVYIELSIGDWYGERRLYLCLGEKHLYLFENEAKEMAMILADFAQNKGVYFPKHVSEMEKFDKELLDLLYQNFKSVKAQNDEEKNNLGKLFDEFKEKWGPKD